jgi:hypothetical protein
MNYVKRREEKISSSERVCLFENYRNRQVLFSAMIYFDEGVSLETLFTFKVGKSLICLVDTRRPNFVIEAMNKE